MSHRGEGSVYHEKTPPDKQMPGPPGPGPSKASAGRASDPSEGRAIEQKPVITPPALAMPDPSRMRAAQPPPPPPLPGSGFGEGVAMPTQSELAKRMAEAQDTHSLAAHKIVDRLRTTLTSVAQLAEEAKHDLTDTVGARTIIIHGPTGTGKIYCCALGSDEVAGRALCGSRDDSRHGIVLAAKTESHHFAC